MASVAVGTAGSTASVAEGNTASVCVEIISPTATTLGLDISVTLTSIDGKATSKLCNNMIISSECQ